MAGLDPAAFDGEQVQAELVIASPAVERSTQICLIAQARDGYVVLSGSDFERERFDDDAIGQIFLTFADVIDAYPGADAATLRMACASALNGLWNTSVCESDCPFDLGARKESRLVFHVYTPGWSFEPARIKFKTAMPDGAFTGLQWLRLNGLTAKPFSFSLDVNPSADQDDPHEFALYIRASQDAGGQSTRIIIDPKITIPPPPPPPPD